MNWKNNNNFFFFLRKKNMGMIPRANFLFFNTNFENAIKLLAWW